MIIISGRLSVHYKKQIKSVLRQIWNSPYMFVFIKKYYPTYFAFLILWILEIFTSKVCEMFVYKHTDAIEYVKK